MSEHLAQLEIKAFQKIAMGFQMLADMSTYSAEQKAEYRRLSKQYWQEYDSRFLEAYGKLILGDDKDGDK